MAKGTKAVGKAAGKIKGAAAAVTGDRGIFRHLKEEHTEVNVMLKALKAAKGDTRRKQFDEMRRELLAHAKAEEAEFYPVLRNAEETRDLAEDAIDDHARIEDLLDRLSEMDVDSETFGEVCDELASEVEDHVQMEEKELIPAAQRIIDDERAKELDERYTQKKQELMGRVS
jgi:hemerythrin superfamily protein